MFFTDEDRRTYLQWLKACCDKHAGAVLAYCLMTNHVHLVAVPARDDGLHRALNPLLIRYAQRINRGCGWHGHLWQGRFFSSPLDDAYPWAASRYVERNPVRARRVCRAENYAWSSAASHCARHADAVLTPAPTWRERLAAVDDWSAWFPPCRTVRSLALQPRRLTEIKMDSRK